MKRIGYYVLCCPLILTSTFAYAVTSTTENIKLYPIYGSTADELRAQMRKLGPLVDNHPYDAYTRYYVKWRFELNDEEGDCKISSTHVTVHTNYTYPEWKNYTSASPVMQRNWDEYIVKLKHHERKHGEHGVNAAYEIDKMLMRLPAMPTCAALEKTANARAYDILGKYQQADVDYDRETDHGIKRGVVLQDE